MAELLDDLEDELMDLESNEVAYLPAQPQPMLRHTFSGRTSFSNSSSSGASDVQRGVSLSEAPTDARLVGRIGSLSFHGNANGSSAYSVPAAGSVQNQYQPQQQYQQAAPVVQQQQRRNRFQSNSVAPTLPAPKPAATSAPPSRTSSSSSLSLSSTSVTSSLASIASSLGLRAPESSDANQDESWMRKKSAFNAIAQLRTQQITERVGQRINSSTVRQPLWDPSVDAMTQMTTKLDAVIEASLQELQATPEIVGLWTQVLAELPTEESDYMAKAADEKFEEQMKYCTSRRDEREIYKCIDHHLQAILVSSVPTRNGYSMGKVMNHTLGQLLRDFRGVFLACYETFVAQYEVHQVAQVLPLVSADVLQFASILVQLLVFKYAFLAKWKDYVRRCVIAVLFELLQPTLHGLYVGALQAEDAVMYDITDLKRANPPAEFHIAPVFRLDGSWRPRSHHQSAEADNNTNESPEASRQACAQQYSAVIYKMNNLASIRSPWVKIETLAHICRDIDATIKNFYAQQRLQQPGVEQPSPEEINVNADDLRAILAFVLVSSPSMCLHVFSQLAILSSFMPQTSASGEEGFALATFTSAVRTPTIGTQLKVVRRSSEGNATSSHEMPVLRFEKVARRPIQKSRSPIYEAIPRFKSLTWMPPKRAATAGSKSARRPHHGWHNDSASKHSHSSLDVLLAWLTTPGNYSRWVARSSGPSSSANKGSGEGRLSLCKEVNALLQREGIAHRKDMDVYAKIVVIEKSFHAAKKWLEETALMPKFLHGTAGKDVEANVNQLCRHYKELAPAFAVTSNETAASEVVDIEDDDEEENDAEDGAKSDTTTSTDDAEEKPRAINGHNEKVGAVEAAGGEQGPPSCDDTANESIDEISSLQPELYALSPVHDETTVAVVSTTTTIATTSTTASLLQQKQREENGIHRSVQHEEYEETKENGPPEPDSPSQELQRSSSSPASSNKFKRIRQRIASQLSDDEAELPVSSALSEQQQQQQQAKQQGTHIALPSATTFTKVLTTVQRGDVGSPAREKTAVALRIEKPSIAPKRKTSGLLKDAIAATSAELSPPSSRKKQKTQWTEQQELKKKQQYQDEDKTVKQLQQEYLKKQQQQQQEVEKKKRLQQEEFKKKKLLHQEELKKKHQLRQEELSKKRQQEYERKKQQEFEELKKKAQRREDLLNKKKQQEKNEANRKKQEQEEEAMKKTSSISTQPVSKNPTKYESQKQQSPKQLQRHPEELKAILRACEDEREQRHALFQLQCDKLMQELEEKKIKVVYETALARKKLLDVGVAQSEVDRILPL